MKVSTAISVGCLMLFLVPGLGFAGGLNTEMTKHLKDLEAQAKKESGFKAFDAERGKKLFSEAKPNDKTGTIACTTCHTTDLKKSGKTLVGKAIEPLAPSANKNRLTNVKEVEKWLSRNFKQVYGREGTPREKGDVLTYINAQ
jgi:cytochrome c553